MNRKELTEWIQERTLDEVVLYDGFDEAFIGIARRGMATVAVYDIKSCIECLIRNGLEEADAIDYFEYNTMGTHVGENTPVFMTDNIYFFGAELLSEKNDDIVNKIQ